jgi:NADPH-dependent 2,4-dienoyl-CoA reductase/sulfur reductase-like enzyme
MTARADNGRDRGGLGELRRAGGGGIVIAGAGLAAQRAAETLRRGAYDGRLRMICAERHRPYDRPPLSKEVLAGVEHGSFRPTAWYEEHGVELELGVAAAGLDCRQRAVTVADGRELRYDRLLIATGSRPRRLALLDGFANVHTLRTLDDARALRAALADGGRLVIVGAGFIGQEVAAAAARAGVQATIVEAADAPLQALLGADVGAWFAELHRSQGVEVILGADVAAAHGAEGLHVPTLGDGWPGADGVPAPTLRDRCPGAERVHALTLRDGRRLACDHVVVGVGVDPDLAWLAGSGLDPTGVAVDANGRTAAPDVFAAGDAAATYDPVLRRHVPGGHWESAVRQGVAAARAMLGREPQRSAPASFWSDLYDTRVQYLGNARLADRTAIDGDPAARDFTITFTRDGAPVAVLLVGRPHELPNARALLAV